MTIKNVPEQIRMPTNWTKTKWFRSMTTTNKKNNGGNSDLTVDQQKKTNEPRRPHTHIHTYIHTHIYIYTYIYIYIYIYIYKHTCTHTNTTHSHVWLKFLRRGIFQRHAQPQLGIIWYVLPHYKISIPFTFLFFQLF